MAAPKRDERTFDEKMAEVWRWVFFAGRLLAVSFFVALAGTWPTVWKAPVVASMVTLTVMTVVACWKGFRYGYDEAELDENLEPLFFHGAMAGIGLMLAGCLALIAVTVWSA